MEAANAYNEQFAEEDQKIPTQEETKKLIIITGFGVFEGHEEKNASWEAVKLLPETLEHFGEEFRIEKMEIPVEYEAVDNALEHIWSQNPALVIHVGVHGQSECIRVERLAYNHKFNRPDYAGKRLKKASACLKNCDAEQSDVKLTCLRVDKICGAACACKPGMTPPTKEEIHANPQAALQKMKEMTEALTISSNDVGNYLCGYIYIKSLDYDDKRTLFVHVPPVEKLSPEAVSHSLVRMAKECIRQLKEDLKIL